MSTLAENLSDAKREIMRALYKAESAAVTRKLQTILSKIERLQADVRP